MKKLLVALILATTMPACSLLANPATVKTILDAAYMINAEMQADVEMPNPDGKKAEK